MSPGGQAGGSGSSSSGAGSPEGLRGWVRGAYRFATDRNDFRSLSFFSAVMLWTVTAAVFVLEKKSVRCQILGKNLVFNLGLFALGVWVARNLTDIDLMAPQPIA